MSYQLLTFIAAKYNIDLAAEAANLEPETPPLMQLITRCCEVIGANLARVVSKTRKREIVQQRQCVMRVIYDTGLFSLSEIGRAFGNRDHTTVIHARQTVEDMLDTHNSSFIQYMEKLTNYIKIYNIKKHGS